MTRPLALASILVATLVVARAEAQPKPPPKPQPAPAPKPAPAPPPPITRQAPALARVAEQLAQSLAALPGRALVVAGPLTSDAPAPRGAQLAIAVANQLAGRRGGGARAHSDAAPLALARGLAHGETRLVHLAVEIVAGQLRASADVYPIPRTVWARTRDPEPGPIGHAFATAPIDAEIRSFLVPVPLTAMAPIRGKNFESDVVALACGDLDGDGAPEIVSVSRRRVSALRLSAGKVVPVHSRPWGELAPVAPAPLREPIGFSVVAARAGGDEGTPVFVDVGLTDRARSVRLDGQLRLAGLMGGIAVPDGDGSACTRISALTVTGPIGSCVPGDPAPLAPSVGGQYDAFASARLVSPRGEPFAVWAGREAGVVELRDERGRRERLEGAGAQLAVADLDQDGAAEVVASLDTQNPLEDAVVVWTWPPEAGAKPREVARIPAPAGVRALAACPPDGAGRSPFVVATADEIWVVR